MQHIHRKRTIAPKKYVPSDDTVHISLKDAFILYVNFYKAIEDPNGIGYMDADNKASHFSECLTQFIFPLKKSELESLLWSSVMRDEAGEAFWHTENKSVNEFISGLAHPKQLAKYFDKFYCFFRDADARKGTPPDAIVALGAKEGKSDV